MATQGIDSTTSLIAPDIAAQQVMLQRRQTMADLLRQQSLQPLQGGMVGEQYIAPSWSQGLAKMAQALMASKSQDSIDAQNLDLAKQYQGRLASQLEDSNGPAVTGTTGPTVENAARLDANGGNVQAALTPVNANGSPRIDLAAALRGRAIEALGGTGAAGAYWDRFKPTDTAKDMQNLPPEMRSAAWAQKFMPAINSHSGAVLTADRNGNYVVAPSSIDAIRQVGIAKSGVENDNTIEKILRPDGTYREVTKAQRLAEINPLLKNSGDGGISQAGLDAIKGDIQLNGNPSPSVNVSSGASSAPGTVAYNDRTPKAGGNIVGQSTFDKEFQSKEAGRASDLSGEIYKNGSAAIQKIATNNKMLSLLPTITTGPAADRITAFRNLASSAGVNIGDPAPNQEFGKYAFQGAMQAGKQIYGTRITNADLEALIKNSPGTTLEEKASRALIQFDNELQARNIQKMTEFDAYKASGNDLTRFEPWFEQNFPYHGISAPLAGSQVSIPIPAVAPSVAGVDYAKKYGIKAKK